MSDSEITFPQAAAAAAIPAVLMAALSPGFLLTVPANEQVSVPFVPVLIHAIVFFVVLSVIFLITKTTNPITKLIKPDSKLYFRGGMGGAHSAATIQGGRIFQ
jgi:uncharacterized membrane protein YdcZ (DUF606 family)